MRNQLRAKSAAGEFPVTLVQFDLVNDLALVRQDAATGRLSPKPPALLKEAAIGLVELERYDRETLPRRKAICDRYHAAFANDDRFLAPVLKDDMRESSYHLFMLRVAKATEDQRDTIIEGITRRGVSVNVHFIPMPMLSFYKGLGYRMEDHPRAYASYSREISLPVYFDLTDQQVDQVIAAVKAAEQEVMGAKDGPRT